MALTGVDMPNRCKLAWARPHVAHQRPECPVYELRITPLKLETQRENKGSCVPWELSIGATCALSLSSTRVANTQLPSG